MSIVSVLKITLSSCVHENIFILPSLLNDKMAKCRIIGSKFILQTICLLPYIFVIKKSNVRWSFLDSNCPDKLLLYR